MATLKQPSLGNTNFFISKLKLRKRCKCSQVDHESNSVCICCVISHENTQTIVKQLSFTIYIKSLMLLFSIGESCGWFWDFIFFLKSLLLLQDVSIREYIMKLHQNHDFADYSVNKNSRRYGNRLRNGIAIFDYITQA